MTTRKLIVAAVALTNLLAQATSAQVVDPQSGSRFDTKPEAKVTPEPAAENPAIGPRNSDTGVDDSDADAPKGSFGSGAGSRGTHPGQEPKKAGVGDTLD